MGWKTYQINPSAYQHRQQRNIWCILREREERERGETETETETEIAHLVDSHMFEDLCVL